ncbi:MAG: hypothetical protein ACTSRG_26455, partial [Candidatus Helarchaeota archaeon]
MDFSLFLVLIVSSAFILVSIFSNFEIGLYSLLIFASFDGLLKKICPEFVPLLFAKDIILITLYLKLILKKAIQKRKLSNIKYPITFYFFMGFCALLILAPNNNEFLVKLAGLRELILYLPLVFVGNIVIDNWSSFKRFAKLSIFLCIVVSIFGLLQFFSHNHLVYLFGEGYEDAVQWYSMDNTIPLRIFSTLTDPAALSLFMGILIFIFFSYSQFVKKPSMIFVLSSIPLISLLLSGT